MGSTAVMNLMLGWLKGVASWVLSLFDLAGTTGFSPLAWLSENWLMLLIVLLAAGIALDFLIWLVRWRPHWVWFGKKRIVINDDDFFAGEDLVDSGLYEPELFDAPPVQRRRTAPRDHRRPDDGRRPARRRVLTDEELFSVDSADDINIAGEDDVFNVSDLPVSDDEMAYRNSQQKKRR